MSSSHDSSRGEAFLNCTFTFFIAFFPSHQLETSFLHKIYHSVWRASTRIFTIITHLKGDQTAVTSQSEENFFSGYFWWGGRDFTKPGKSFFSDFNLNISLLLRFHSLSPSHFHFRPMIKPTRDEATRSKRKTLPFFIYFYLFRFTKIIFPVPTRDLHIAFTSFSWRNFIIFFLLFIAASLPGGEEKCDEGEEKFPLALKFSNLPFHFRSTVRPEIKIAPRRPWDCTDSGGGSILTFYFTLRNRSTDCKEKKKFQNSALLVLLNDEKFLNCSSLSKNY